MTSILQRYADIVGNAAVESLKQAARPLEGRRLAHVNSTREGGGVAEILSSMVPLMEELGIEVTWEVIEGEAPFFEVTKAFHNGLQGNPVAMTAAMLDTYQEYNARNAERLRPLLEQSDVVFIHDPQPAPLLKLCSGRRGKWIWRCHIDVSRPHPPVWDALRPFVAPYDASIFHMQEYRKVLDHTQAIIPPSIDAFSPKNEELPASEVEAIRTRFGLDPARPLVIQVSRFDLFKDPLGVIAACRQAKQRTDLQLVLAGGGASDDPEGAQVLEQVQNEAQSDPDFHVLLLPPDAHRTINCLQRSADIVLQKSLKEGFGLTVTEAMWKGRPVIGGDTGGIRLQIENGRTGFLVGSIGQAAERIVDLLSDSALSGRLAAAGREHVRTHFLLTRHTMDYLKLATSL